MIKKVKLIEESSGWSEDETTQRDKEDDDALGAVTFRESSKQEKTPETPCMLNHKDIHSVLQSPLSQPTFETVNPESTEPFQPKPSFLTNTNSIIPPCLPQLITRFSTTQSPDHVYYRQT